MKRKFAPYLKCICDGLFANNPTFVQLLGMCPTLATTTSVTSAFGMGMAATVVLVFSGLFISLLRRIIPAEVRIAAYIVIIAGFVTAVQMLIAAFLPSLDASLGVFIPLIVVNCIILARAEAFASKHAPLYAAADGLGMGLGFTGALVLIAAVRELLGAGTFCGLPVLTPLGYTPMLFFLLPCGAFVTLGILLAAVGALRAKLADLRRKGEDA